MSSSGRRGDAARCRQLGISGYLQKPVMQKDLLKAIRIVLGLVKSEQKSNILVTRHTIRESENKLHVLLVEDNMINRKLAVKMLETRGFTTKVASHGKDALSLLKEERFDLILMDVQMPVMDGLTATAEIRNLEMKTGTHIPIIALTAHAMDGDRERCLQAGMDDYVSKPFDPQEFFRVIDQVISSSKKAGMSDERESER
jgi:CheY-like chemotaxis protein